MRKDNTLYLHEDGPFWNLVKSFQLFWYGIATVYSIESPPLNDQKPLLSLGCKSDSRVFYQHHAEILALKESTSAQAAIYDLDCLLTNMAYETVKDFNDNSPEFEFFRHLRNAASHKNKFSFSQIEPQRPAYWGNLSIDHTVKGKKNPLNGTQCFGPFVYSGDLLFLLNDIEEKILTEWLSKQP